MFSYPRLSRVIGTIIPRCCWCYWFAHQRIVFATGKTTVTQVVSCRPITCQSRLWSQRVTKINGSKHRKNPLLKPTGIQTATKPLPGTTNREHEKPIGTKTLSLGKNYSFYVLGRCQYFRIQVKRYREDCLMCCPSNNVIKRDSNTCYRRVTRRQDMRHSKLYGTVQCQNGTSNLLTLYREQPQLTRIVIAYPRPVFSAAKRINHAPISVDQQVHISQVRK